jgi:hypothetical protein
MTSSFLNQQCTWLKEVDMDTIFKASDITGVSGSSKLNFLYNHKNIFLMDNHLAAIWCWEKFRCANEITITPHLIHIDYHNDCKSDYEDIEVDVHNIASLNIDDFIAKRSSTNGQPIHQWDNYIMPYSKYHQQMTFNFHTQESESGVPNNRIEQITDILELDTSIYPSLLWNFDVDVLYTSDDEIPYLMYSDEMIELIGTKISNIASNSQACITIALSPSCCGGWNKALSAFSILNQSGQLGFDNAVTEITNCVMRSKFYW